MYCLTRKDMKFGNFFVPAKTKCTVINKLNTMTVNASGVQLTLAIRLWDMKYQKPCLITEVSVKDELSSSYSASSFEGIVVHTNTENVYMDAGDRLYWDKDLYDWEVEKIFQGSIPAKQLKDKLDKVKLSTVLDVLDEEFAEWIRENCDFKTLTEEDIDNGEGIDGSEPGDTVLSDYGMNRFYEKQTEYQAKLELLGYTYEFKGGLIWD